MRRRTILVAGGVAATAALTAGGVAVATDGGDDGPLSHQYTEGQRQKAVDAALAATDGGTANSVETDSENGATYEVEVTKPDGDTVDVRLDEHFEVVVIEGDGEG
ncbi:PepSY domain-containing protein [Nocardioides taihuensis]|uniref:PepSY domain-containing protein n=1 Tax=Nocardioides taihuensis TaxID=1835606 RepID=A0ABW0BFR2_9ACTN